MQNDFKLKVMLLTLMGNLATKGSVAASNIPIDLFSSNDKLIIKAELPGVEKKDIFLTSYDKEIVIHYTKTVGGGKKRVYYRMERSYGKFEERIKLPIYTEDAKIKAELSDGVLTITISSNKHDIKEK